MKNEATVRGDVQGTEVRGRRLAAVDFHNIVAETMKAIHGAMLKTQVARMEAEHGQGVDTKVVDGIARKLRLALNTLAGVESHGREMLRHMSPEQPTAPSAPESGTIPAAKAVQVNPGDGPFVDVAAAERIRDAKGAIANALKAIDEATLHGQDAESVADGEDIPSPGAFGKIYGALRVARENLRGGLVDLDEAEDPAWRRNRASDRPSSGIEAELADHAENFGAFLDDLDVDLHEADSVAGGAAGQALEHARRVVALMRGHVAELRLRGSYRRTVA
jgi:hypothetical protein